MNGICTPGLVFLLVTTQAMSDDSMIGDIVPPYASQFVEAAAQCIGSLDQKRQRDVYPCPFQIVVLANRNDIASQQSQGKRVNYNALAHTLVLTKNLASNKERWEIVDQIAIPGESGVTLSALGSCRQNGEWDNTIVALVRASSVSRLKASGWAYRVVSGEFLPVPPSEVDCGQTFILFSDVNGSGNVKPVKPQQSSIVQLADGGYEIRSPPLATGPAFITRFPGTLYRENGRIVGYKVTDDPFLNIPDLVLGDIITSINGVLLVSRENAARALRRSVKSQTFDMEILRDGETLNIIIPIDTTR